MGLLGASAQEGLSGRTAERPDRAPRTESELTASRRDPSPRAILTKVACGSNRGARGIRTMNVPVSPRDLPVPEESSTMGIDVLESQEWRQLDAYWRAANYLSVGQIYLYANRLLREPLTLAHVKPLVVGHWGTTPGQNFIYVHLNRTIRLHDLDMIYIAGPGHGGPALVANTYLEGSYSEIYPDISQDEAGMKRLFKQFSFPGGISSHVAPSTLGSIH